jgi:hypothetical protein
MAASEYIHLHNNNNCCRRWVCMQFHQHIIEYSESQDMSWSKWTAVSVKWAATQAKSQFPSWSTTVRQTILTLSKPLENVWNWPLYVWRTCKMGSSLLFPYDHDFSVMDRTKPVVRRVSILVESYIWFEEGTRHSTVTSLSSQKLSWFSRMCWMKFCELWSESLFHDDGSFFTFDRNYAAMCTHVRWSVHLSALLITWFTWGDGLQRRYASDVAFCIIRFPLTFDNSDMN